MDNREAAGPGGDPPRFEAHVLESLQKGIAFEAIVSDLMKEGWSMKDASQFVRQVMQKNRIGMGSLQLRRLDKLESPHLVWTGGILLVLGLVASVGSYLHSVEIGSPSFVVAGGAIASGAGMLWLGLSKRSSSRPR